MQFFIPKIKKSEIETVYSQMIDVIKDQLRLSISARKIFSITYIRDKKEWHSEVGKLHQQNDRYEVVAIFESRPYVICTRGRDGANGVTILVNKEEITAVNDFES